MSIILFSRLTEAGDDQSDEEDSPSAAPDPPTNPEDEFNFENYDEEEPSMLLLTIIVTYASVSYKANEIWDNQSI